LDRQSIVDRVRRAEQACGCSDRRSICSRVRDHDEYPVEAAVLKLPRDTAVLCLDVHESGLELDAASLANWIGEREIPGSQVPLVSDADLAAHDQCFPYDRPERPSQLQVRGIT
jgi:hypothetical protein